MPMNELEMFLSTWDREAENTLKLLRALPPTQYDFRPDAGGRSLGELAWHLAEGDAYMSYGITGMVVVLVLGLLLMWLYGFVRGVVRP